MRETPVAVCYFLNVGQGTSQVIHLGNRRAIVVDTGPQQCSTRSPLLSLLKDRDIQKIEALILSHNDQDHIGDAPALLDNFKKRIDRVFFLDDRPRTENKLYDILKNSYRKKHITRIIRLENDDIPKNLFSDGNISIDLLFPDCSQNIFAQSPNQTCGIIALSIGTQIVIFSGDAPVEAWKSIVEKNGRIESQIFTIPHHGGGFIRSKPETESVINDLNWFHEKAMQTKFAIVSLGAKNKYGHPSPQIIQSFAERKAEVLCTQVTLQCTGNIEICDAVCCGTIVANIGLNTTQIQNIDGLRERKKEFLHRLCVS